ncbi:MAG: alpha/beta hydrolase [Candidatus Nanopelagicales bacterium]
MRTGRNGEARTRGRRKGSSARSQWVDLDGPVHFIDFGGPPNGPQLVCVHGLGGSVVNWTAVAPALTESCRVLALDLAGFGRTKSAGRPTTVHGNQELLHRFVTELLDPPVVLVGNSMGGLISVLQVDAHPETVAGLVLVDPALPVGLRARPDPLVALIFAAYALPAVGRTFMSRRRAWSSVEERAMDILRLCCADMSRLPADVAKAHLELARERDSYPDVDSELIIAARSLLWVLARRGQHAAMLRRIRVPVLMLHGDKDRLVPIAAARASANANPWWRFEVAHGVGHVPQLEAPDWTAGHILDWLATDGRAAGLGARSGLDRENGSPSADG